MISFFSRLDKLGWFNRLSVIYLFFVVPLYWNYEAYDSTLWEKFLVAHLIVLRLAAGWLIAVWTGRDRVGRCFLDFPVLLYLGWVSCSWLMAINPVKSGMEVVRVLIAATIYFSISRTYRSEYRDSWLAAASAGLGIVAFIGIIQYLGWGFLDWRSAGLPNSTFFYRNYAAMFVILALPLSFAAIFLSRSQSNQVLHSLATTLGLIFLLYTRTRGAWLGMGLAVIAAYAGTRLLSVESRLVWKDAINTRMKMISVCGLIVLAASLIPPGEQSELQTIPMAKSSVANAFTSILAGSSSGRTPAWIQSLGMIVDNPILGVGIGNWDAEFFRYAGHIYRQDGGVFGRPHNDYLWAVTELGIPGLFLFLWVFLGGLWFLAVKLPDEVGDRLILLTCLGTSILAISVHAFFSFPRERVTATVLAFVILGWIFSLLSQSQKPASTDRRRIWQPALLLTLLLLALPSTVNAARSFRAYFWADVYRIYERPDKALESIDRSISYGVVDYHVLELKSLLHYKNGDPRSALEAVEDLLEIQPYNPWHHHMAGLNKLAIKDFAGAKQSFSEALEYGPLIGKIQRDMGQAYEGLGEPDSALVYYRKAAENITRDALLHMKLASLLVDQGEMEEAAENIAISADHLKLTKVDKDVAEVGDVAMKSMAYGSAVVAYGRAAALKPKNLTYQSKLAGALESSGDLSGAARVLRKILTLVGPDDRAVVEEKIARMKTKPEDG